MGSRSSRGPKCFSCTDRKQKERKQEERGKKKERNDTPSREKKDERGRGSVDTSFYRVSVRVLVLKCRRTRLKSEVNYSEKDSYPKKIRQKEGGEESKPKTSGEKNVSTKVFRVCRF